MTILRMLVCILLFGGAAPLLAQSVQYSVVARDLIETRLKLLPQKNEDRAATIQTLFEQEQCAGPSLTLQKIKRSKIPNVICELPGEDGKVIVVGAHFDKAKAGDGAADNWSGAALLSSFYKSLAGQKRRHTFRFIGFSEEEAGLYGSKDYVRQLSKQQRAEIVAMINVDSVGLTPSKVWASRADKNFLNSLISIAEYLQLPLRRMDVEEIGDSDSRPFLEAKIPVIDIHSITSETLPILHTSKDTLDKIEMDSYYDTYKLIAAYLAYLDATWPPTADAAK